jgi:hypothetical protein
MVRLRALVELGRIEMPALHGANRPRHIAITGVRDARQGGGKVEQKCVTACHSQWASRGDDGIELTVAQFDRRHATDSAAGSRHTLERERSQCDAAYSPRTHTPLHLVGEISSTLPTQSRRTYDFVSGKSGRW